MSGRKSRRKGAHEERMLVRALQERGFAAEKASRSGYGGHDISIPLLGVNRHVEVKVRADGFRELYKWLDARDFLIVRADRCEPLVVVPLKFAVEVARFAERAHAEFERREAAHEKHVADVQEALDNEFGK